MAHLDLGLEQMASWFGLDGAVTMDTLLKDVENSPSTLTEHIKNILTSI
ncbi:MAG: hypothetical protein MI867_29715 [Pseudomonadales bacterium]|nr:hypothetical protein [Pseudomonadales bacterium]